MSFSDLDAKSVMLGEHNAQLKAQQQDIDEIKGDVKAILAFIENSKGSWKTLVALASVGGTIVEGMHHLGPWIVSLFGKHP